MKTNEKLYKQVLRAYERSKKWREERKIQERWEKAAKLYENDAWKAMNATRDGELSQVKVAIAFDIVETGLPIATGRPPRPEIKIKLAYNSPEYQQYKAMLQQGMEKEAAEFMALLQEKFDEYSRRMQRRLVMEWKESGMQSKIRQAYREVAKYGNAIIKSVWDSEGKELVNEVVDLSTIFPCPDVSTIEGHTDHIFIYAPIMPVMQAKRLYGLDEIAEQAIGELLPDGTFKRRKTGWFANLSSAMQADGDDGYVRVIEAYMPDREKVSVEQAIIDEQTGQAVGTEMVETLRYASGYKRVTVIDGQDSEILEEVENPYGRPPFYMVKGYEQAGDFYGLSILEVIDDLIMRVNIGASNINDNLRLHGNPSMWVWRQGLEDDQKITNKIGKIYYANQPNPPVGYINPPSISMDTAWWMGWLKEWIDRISHMSDAMRGFNENASDSGRKIQILKQAAQGSFQPILDAQIDLDRELFQHWAWIYQNMSEDPELQYEGDESGEYVEFDPSSGRGYELYVDVSNESILPEDIYGQWETAVQLYQMQDPLSGMPLVSAEMLIEIATRIQPEIDPVRMKQYLEDMRDRVDEQRQREAAGEQFDMLVEQIGGMGIEDSPEKDMLFDQVVGLVSGMPDLMLRPGFSALPEVVQRAAKDSVGRPTTGE
jgi:hypothetical protein